MGNTGTALVLDLYSGLGIRHAMINMHHYELYHTFGYSSYRYNDNFEINESIQKDIVSIHAGLKFGLRF